MFKKSIIALSLLFTFAIPCYADSIPTYQAYPYTVTSHTGNEYTAINTDNHTVTFYEGDIRESDNVQIGDTVDAIINGNQFISIEKEYDDQH